MSTTFEEFYALYPRKKSRGDAFKAWGQALKKGQNPDEIMEGLRRNLASMQMKDPQFVPYPATWLRAEGWADEPDISQPIRVPLKPSWQRRTIADVAREMDARFAGFDAPVSLPSLTRN